MKITKKFKNPNTKLSLTEEHKFLNELQFQIGVVSKRSRAVVIFHVND